VSEPSAITQIRVLIVEDDGGVAATLHRYLERSGMVVTHVRTGTEALEAKPIFRPDVVLVDLELPDTHGITLIERLRRDADCGIIVVSGSTDEVDRVAGIEVGADDYIAKPPAMRELAARIRAVHRRARQGHGGHGAEPAAANLRRLGPLTVDLSAHSVVDSAGGPVLLTAAEFNLLVLLLDADGGVVSRRFLCERVLRRPLGAEDRSVDQLVFTLRRKLTASSGGAVTILAERGLGYRFAFPTPGAPTPPGPPTSSPDNS
jgi:DNA-binding response OmpR family regulator